MARAWNVDAPVTVDAVANTFTADVTDPNAILMSEPWLVDHITVTLHMQAGQTMPVVDGSVLLVRLKVAGS